MSTQSQRRGSVLVVEDDPILRRALVVFLARLGFTVHPAGTVAEAVAGLDGQVCAVVDLNLPDGLGTAVLERIHAEGRPIRVAVASGTDDEALWAEAERHRPGLLLRKPYDLNALLAWLNEAG